MYYPVAQGRATDAELLSFQLITFGMRGVPQHPTSMEAEAQALLDDGVGTLANIVVGRLQSKAGKTGVAKLERQLESLIQEVHYQCCTMQVSSLQACVMCRIRESRVLVAFETQPSCKS